jgi:hypothetical protein
MTFQTLSLYIQSKSGQERKNRKRLQLSKNIAAKTQTDFTE